MNAYFWLKLIHIIDRSVRDRAGDGVLQVGGRPQRQCRCHPGRFRKKVVFAEGLFTTPAIAVQAVTGVTLARLMGYPLLHGWILYAIALYCLAGACWLPVLVLQIRMRDLARSAEQAAESLDKKYWSYARIWFWLGVPAFLSVVMVFCLMVIKPTL